MDEGRLEAPQAVAYQRTVISAENQDIFLLIPQFMISHDGCKFSTHWHTAGLFSRMYGYLPDSIMDYVGVFFSLLNNVNRSNIFSLFFRPINAEVIYQSVGPPSHTAPSTIMDHGSWRRRASPSACRTYGSSTHQQC